MPLPRFWGGNKEPNHSERSHVCAQAHKFGMSPEVALVLVFESSHPGRECPGKSFSKETLLWSRITHPLRASKGREYLGLEYPGPGHCLETRWDWWDSIPRVLAGGFWLWRPRGGSRESWEGCGVGSALRSSFWDLSSTAAAVPKGCDPPRDLGGSGIWERARKSPPPGRPGGLCRKRDLQALPKLCFALLGFWEPPELFSEYCRSICREQLQRLAQPQMPFPGVFLGAFLGHCPLSQGTASYRSPASEDTISPQLG